MDLKNLTTNLGNNIASSLKQFIGLPMTPLTQEAINQQIQNTLGQQNQNYVWPNLTSSYTPTTFTITTAGTASSSASTGWVKYALDVDPDVFKKYVFRMAGKVLRCIEHIEEDTFIVPKDFALRYIYQGLRGKWANTDITALDAMEINDEIWHLWFDDPQSNEKTEAVIYDEKELDLFIEGKKEEEKDREKIMSNLAFNPNNYIIIIGPIGSIGVAGQTGTGGYPYITTTNVSTKTTETTA